MNTPSGDAHDRIADGLADHGWAVSPAFLTPAQASTLLAESVSARDRFHPAGVGRAGAHGVRSGTRSDSVCWLGDAHSGPGQAAYLAAMDGLRAYLNQSLYLGLLSYDAHFASYPVGAFYARHLDALHGPGARRTLSCVLYLNPDWTDADGGHLRLYLDGDRQEPFMDVRPEAGTLVTFLSERFEHEVLTSTRERSSVTGWFSGRT
ncbi:hypothetical protein BSZ36_04715 [Rubricoccus marinus]|uniref:Fe2OG dioxygenase domain-containing protein n=1 Tax=Rubricoccus marinus TaxID=716817 RepID=A0A259U3S2_9BACT|nr:hypothetical protein BSZ36_04715 [Rubricoccus marinus]